MSKVEVNQVTQQCGTTLTVGGGACKTAVVDATTVTLGRCGGTVSLASGATQSGFGRTGTVDWDTSIKTGTVTAVNGSGYFVNTTSGGITVNLPAASVGSIVAVSDYASTANSNNITITPNGSEKINGVNADYTISTNGLAVTFVYADATRGWKSVTGSDADATGVVSLYVTATGGTPCSGAIVCTNYKVHTFTGPGTLCVSCAGNPSGSTTVDYLVIAGGGGGGGACTGSNWPGGGAGAGGYRESPGAASGCYTVSPLGVSPAAAITVSATGYPITVGGGGNGAPACAQAKGTNGVNSVFSSITSTGGGGGGTRYGPTPSVQAGEAGGSGGGGSGDNCGSNPAPRSDAGAGNTPSVTPAQGKSGGLGGWSGGGGGGALVAGTAGSGPPIVPSSLAGVTGGNGATSSINATPTARAGGGGSGGIAQTPSTPGPTPSGIGGAAGSGGGGAGGNAYPQTNGAAATINTGGGGGGAGGNSIGPGCVMAGGNGGSGIVIIRYKFQ